MKDTASAQEEIDDGSDCDTGDDDVAMRCSLRMRAFQRPPSISIHEAARRGIRWAVQRVAALASPETPGESTLTPADKNFLSWLASAAVAFYHSEKNTPEG